MANLPLPTGAKVLDVVVAICLFPIAAFFAAKDWLGRLGNRFTAR